MSNEEYSTNQSGHKVKKTLSPDGKNVQFSLVSETEQSAIPQVENKITIELDDKKYNALLEEKNQLEHALEKVAQKEFDERSSAISQKLGVAKEEINFDNLKGFESMLQKKEAEDRFYPKPVSGGDTIPLNPPIDYNPNSRRTTFKLDDSRDLPIDMLSFDSTEEAIAELERRSKNGDATSKQYLAQLIKSTFGKSAIWEWNGKSSLNLIKDPLPINDSDSDNLKAAKRKKNAEIMRDKLAWVRVE